MRDTTRRRHKERREQIIDVTLALVARFGVTGTTLARIAEEVGVTTPALYAHFANRREILLAAADVLVERRIEHHRQFSEGTALERLRQIGLSHSQLVESPESANVLALFEFIAAPPEEGLREALGARELLLVESLATVVREGQKEGTISTEADPLQVAWMLVGRAWLEDLTHLIKVTEHWTEARSGKFLDLILGSIVWPEIQGEEDASP